MIRYSGSTWVTWRYSDSRCRIKLHVLTSGMADHKMADPRNGGMTRKCKNRTSLVKMYSFIFVNHRVRPLCDVKVVSKSSPSGQRGEPIIPTTKRAICFIILGIGGGIGRDWTNLPTTRPHKLHFGQGVAEGLTEIAGL